MWPDPPVPGTARPVYFNGFLAQEAGYGAGAPTVLNPNSATLETRLHSYPYRPTAMLGVWKDCNGDGFIGSGEDATLVYPSQLMSTWGCPPENVPPSPEPGQYPPHNDGVWVHEFVPLGWHRSMWDSQTRFDANPRDISGYGSRVWADDGLPGAPPTSTCYPLAHPSGSMGTPHGLLSILDCYGAGRARFLMDATFDSAGVRDDWDSLRSFRNPWGMPSDPSFVDLWDCEAWPLPESFGVVVPPPGSGRLDASGSPSGSIHHVLRGANGCRYGHDDVPWIVATAPYALEADHAPPTDGVRRTTDFTLQYRDGDPGPTGVAIYHTGYWASDTVRAVSKNPFFSRSEAVPEPVDHVTYYAFVDPAAITTYSLSLPISVGSYGSEACGTLSSGNTTLNGWLCDADEWWPNETMPRSSVAGREPSGEPAAIGARFGHSYQLRDVDCFDSSMQGLREEGVHWGVASGTRCA